MKFSFALGAAVAAAIIPSVAWCASNAPSTADQLITVGADQPGIPLNPGFYGLMTEEINHAFDGGLYAELIQNRNFKMDPTTPVHWTAVQEGGGTGQIALSTDDPLSTALPDTLELTVTSASGTGRVGAANNGYWGIPVRPHTPYTASFYAESKNGFSGSITVALESADGSKTFAMASVAAITPTWAHYTVHLTTGDVPVSTDNRFVIYASKSGTVRLSLVSLFPPTYHNRVNGNRIDLMEKLAAMKPAFLRMPGGNYLDPGHYIWKNTIGPLKDRPGSQGAWGYPIDEGLGLLEMLEWCEDLHMEPLLAVSDGRGWMADDADVSPLVQDALDEIEFATGPATSTWGSLRAKYGHPAPFKIDYVEVGNEDFFADRGVYNAHFPKFYDAIKSKYPNLQIIATSSDTPSRTPDLRDEHYYLSAKQMEQGAYKYDAYPRTGPKIFVGEWATVEGSPTPYLYSAISDGAWLTGLERNADIVKMESYAPLFVNVNNNAAQWGTNLIGYDALTSFGSPSYYVQSLFSNNHGDSELPTKVTRIAPVAPTPVPTGGVGVATWNTQAKFRNVTVTSGGATLSPSDPMNTFAGWQNPLGSWSLADNVETQTSGATSSLSFLPNNTWTDYTYHVEAQKIGGAEGFLIAFHARDTSHFIWWNIGGWGNTITQLQRNDGSGVQSFGPSIPMSVDTGKWYSIDITVAGTDIKCYLDGKLIEEATDSGEDFVNPVFASASRVTSNGSLYLHIVNAASTPQNIEISLSGIKSVSSVAEGQVLTGQPNDQNSIQQPKLVSPKPIKLTNASATFVYNAPSTSVTVLTLTHVVPTAK